MAYRTRHVTQADEPPPLIDCGAATGSMWFDKGVAGQVNLIDKDTLRAASGDLAGGMDLDAISRGINRLYPSVTMAQPRFDDWDDVEYMGANGYGCALLVRHADLAAPFNRYAPGFKDGHWIFFEDYQQTVSLGKTFRLLNALAPAGHPGVRIPTDVLERAARFYRTKNGYYELSPVMEGSLMSTGALTREHPPQLFHLQPGTVTGWRWDDAKGAYVFGKRLTLDAPTTSVVSDATVAIAQYPVRNRSPYGTFERITNGFFAGLAVVQTAGVLMPPADADPVPPPSCVPQIEDAVAPYASALADIKARIAQAEAPRP